MNRDEIDEARREIDAIDAEIVELLARRARCAVEIGRAKRRRGVPVRDPARESTVLDRVRERARPPLDASGLEHVYERIIELMRRLEEEDASPDKESVTP